MAFIEKGKKSLGEQVRGSIKKIIPAPVFRVVQPVYHFFLAQVAAAFYRYPSRRMLIVGVTGTKGKTSTANFLWSCFTAGGYKTGLLSSAMICIGSRKIVNPYHMTMPGRFTLQQLLWQMVKEGCTHCVVEVTSEGIKQFRHIGIEFDCAIFTNLSPEHLSSHGGSFDKYQKTKGKLFASLSKKQAKILMGSVVPSAIIANADSPHASFFLAFPADKKITYGLNTSADIRGHSVKLIAKEGTEFFVGRERYLVRMWGAFHVSNALGALAAAQAYGVEDEAIRQGIGAVSVIPGRMEKIDAGQDFTVFVDYAHEAVSINASLEAAREYAGKDRRVIVLLGAEGGGRDKEKRPLMGDAAARLADFVIVSNVDPYDDDPMEIIEDITRAAESAGKERGKNLFVVEKRREGIRKAFSLARTNDVVILEGKGSEQFICVRDKKIPWDDRTVAREELERLVGH